MTPSHPHSDFEEIPFVDFSLEQSDPDAYYAQLKYALEDVGFAVSKIA
jgi:hypothetical protein